MKASTLTLTQAVSLIPKILAQRYSQNTVFQMAKANAILQDIEKQFDAEYYKAEYPLILLDGITDYTPNANIRKIRGIHEVYPGHVVPDMDNIVQFEIIGERIRLKKEPVVNDDTDISSTITSVTSKSKFHDTVELASLDENSLRSALCAFTDLSTGLTHHLLVAGNDPADDSISLNGEFPALPAALDTYKVYKNYYMINAYRYINRVTNPATALDILQDWEELFCAGLRFYYDKQSDEQSKNTVVSSNEYARLLKKAASDENRKFGSMPFIKPRTIPNLNLHGQNSSFNGHIIN